MLNEAQTTTGTATKADRDPRTGAPQVHPSKGCRVDTVVDQPAQALTIAQTAARLHVSTASVYRLVRRGKLPGATRIGRSWRVDPRRLDAMFAEPEAAAPWWSAP